MPAFESVVPGGTTIKVNAPTLDAVCWDMVDAPSVAEGITVLLKALVSTAPASHLVPACTRIYTQVHVHAHTHARTRTRKDVSRIGLTALHHLPALHYPMTLSVPCARNRTSRSVTCTI